MKALSFICCMLVFAAVQGQVIRGKVIDKESKRPIPNILIRIRYGKTTTGNNGEFALIPSKNDTLRFSGFNYAPYQLFYTAGLKTEFLIEMTEQAFSLNEVAIFSKRNHKEDSLKLRKEYARNFNYKQPGLKDVFVPVSGSRKVLPFEMVSLDLIGLARLLTRKNNKDNKFKRKLLQDESLAYVDSRFSTELVGNLTRLEGDSLYLFMDKYRPAKDSLLRMSDYQLMMSVKSNLRKFKSGN
ncbi:carboxypeptidase-like regulatory domain-containing protein [Pedobacter caeni]|uniref:CarboxypepD_reg-like domain-containing protein n=1 Tax=Pedobacter caeni TaxID=288992 RepID=A0A1M5PY67_9SPHI|nr:carboxypeptidase-like regulatory domain-containing protein [Pedobacter caeni]SHH06630.1 CarboxypepD_reg-like domain-containing protein [Pedobacter caeni]